MPAGDRDPEPVQRSHVFDLISAVAAGDAAREDIVSRLRDEGIDALDVMIEVLARATRKGPGVHSRSRPVNAQRLSNGAAPERASRIVHRVPQLPFLLQGTLYDPTDIDRFNGKELHFLSTPGRDHLVVIDDRAVMENLWQLSYVSLNLAAPKTLPNYVDPSTLPPPTPPNFELGPPGGSSGPEGFGSPALPPPTPPVPHTNFYEDIFNGGSRLALGAGRQYEDLTEVPWTFFGTGDWNDTISSIEMVLTHTTILHEDVHLSGSTFTTQQNEPNLLVHGWNDRASSVQTF